MTPEAPLPPGVAVRPAAESDVPALSRLYADAVESLGPAFYGPEAVRAWAAFAEADGFPGFVLRPDTLVAEDASGLLGFAGLDDEGEVRSLYVRPDRAREGVASGLLAELLRRGETRGFRRFRTHASALSRPLFERFGFTMVETEMVERAGVPLERYRMERPEAAAAATGPAGFRNVYADADRARAYAGLDYPGTYYLAFRDIPALIARHLGGGEGRRALDFGCGTGRSTRFLKGLGFDAVGVDVAAEMLDLARERDPAGDYRLVPDGDLSALASYRFDLVLSAFTFDNVPGRSGRASLFRELARVLAPGGRVVNLVSAPEIYRHEWASFSTRGFPENRTAGSGDPVRIVMLDVEDRRPVEDVLWTDADYRDLFLAAGLDVLELHHPLGTADDPFEWETELEVSPWSIYVLG